MTTGATGLPSDSRRHAHTQRDVTAERAVPALRAACPTTATPPARCIASTRCGSRLDCAAARAHRANPSGCTNDLFPWVETTIGAGSNGKPQPAGFTDQTTGEGSTSMGFFNIAQGDVPYFK